MKKALICIVMALVLVSALAVSAFAYGMGGTKIYNSSGAEIGSGYIWNQPNNSPYTLGGSVSAKESSTLTVVLIPVGSICLLVQQTNLLQPHHFQRVTEKLLSILIR